MKVNHFLVMVLPFYFILSAWKGSVLVHMVKRLKFLFENSTIVSQSQMWFNVEGLLVQETECGFVCFFVHSKIYLIDFLGDATGCFLNVVELN